MKPVAEWDEGYILSLPVGEFDWLEAKGRRSLDLTLPNMTEDTVLATISKEVSAFANSGGGTLVYGLTDPKAGDTEWHVDDGGVSVSVKKGGTKEWLETVIPNQMDPPLEKFNVYAIPPSGPGTKIGEGRALFVVEVPDSQQAPHQAKDYKYYSRVASRAQPIRHRQVLDILSRRQHPKMVMELVLEHVMVGDGRDIVMEGLALLVTAKNVGRVYGEYVTVVIQLPIQLLDHEMLDAEHVIDREGVRLQEVRLQNTTRDVVDLVGERPHRTRKYGPARFDPILPGMIKSWSVWLQDDFSAYAFPGERLQNEIIRWEVFADSSPTEAGVARITELTIRQRVKEDGSSRE